ncbi:MAG TPA: hypothetical protein VHL11_14495 [Phototrophicaceae bacterium]|jgi:hypothetical protein|nr:hypothetical protein [Phototrophicaceae bacterium]
MLRFIISLVGGLAIGAGIGLFLGWVQFPVDYTNSPARDLAQNYKDEYTVMVAGGFLADGDINGAIQRLRILGVENVPDYVQQVTERFITNSRDVTQIRYLVALAAGLGRTSPLFEPYQVLNAPGTP